MNKNKLIQTVSAAQNGNKEAFVTLYEEYHRLALQTALKLTSDINDAWDIVQESFIEVERSIGKLNHPESFTSWLISIVISKAKLMFRKNNINHLEDAQIDALIEEMSDLRKDNLPRTQVRYQSDMDVINEYISKLSPEHRTVIYMKYFKQMSLQEIASELKIPLGTVKSRLNSAKSILKSDLISYQKNNDINITFDASTLSASLAGLAAANQIDTTVKSLKFSGKIAKCFQTTLTKVVLCSSVLGFGVVSAVLINANESPPDIAKSGFNNQSIKVNSNKFHTINFQGSYIYNPKEAYEALVNWAHCKVELEKESLDSLKKAKELYLELKEYGGGYYDMLYSSGWGETFENICKLKNI